MKIYMMIFVFSAMTACDNRFVELLDRSSQDAKSQPPTLGQPFYLPIGKTVVLDGDSISIRFDSVAVDCRCPDGAMCIWEGYVEVILHVTDSYQHSSKIILSTLNGDKDVTASFFSYRIELIGLTPHPVLDQQIDTTAYEVLLVVSKMNEQ